MADTTNPPEDSGKSDSANLDKLEFELRKEELELKRAQHKHSKIMSWVYSTIGAIAVGAATFVGFDPRHALDDEPVHQIRIEFVAQPNLPAQTNIVILPAK